MYCTGQTSAWQTHDRDHSGKGEVLGGAILLLSWKLLILRWQLWTRFHYKCCAVWGKFNELMPIFASHSFPSTPEVKFTICAPGVPYSMQTLPGPKTLLKCIACNAMTVLWFPGCMVWSPRTKSAHKISQRRCSLIIWRRYSAHIHSDIKRIDSWLNSRGDQALVALRKHGQMWPVWTA